jgi:hypothetical protein
MIWQYQQELARQCKTWTMNNLLQTGGYVSFFQGLTMYSPICNLWMTFGYTAAGESCEDAKKLHILTQLHIGHPASNLSIAPQLSKFKQT